MVDDFAKSQTSTQIGGKPEENTKQLYDTEHVISVCYITQPNMAFLHHVIVCSQKFYLCAGLWFWTLSRIINITCTTQLGLAEC